MQKRYWSLRDQDSTFSLIQWISTIMPSGRYKGFDYSLLGHTLTLHHNTTGVEMVDVNLNSTVKIGMLTTKQGTLILEDSVVFLIVSDNPTNNSRTDAVICTHSYSDTVIGGTIGIYSIVQNVNTSTVYGNDQTVIGYFTVPANSLVSAGTYEQVRIPNVFADDTVAHKDTVNIFTKYNQFKFQGREVDIVYYDANDSKIDFAGKQGSFFVIININFLDTDWHWVTGFKNFDTTTTVTATGAAIVQLYSYGNYMLDTASGAFFQGATNAADFIPVVHGSTATVMTDFSTFAYVDHAGKVDKNNTNIIRGANYSSLGVATYNDSDKTIMLDYKSNHYIVVPTQPSQNTFIGGFSIPTDLNMLRYSPANDGFEYVEFTIEFAYFYGTLVLGGAVQINNFQNYFSFGVEDYSRKEYNTSSRDIYTIRLIFEANTAGFTQAGAYIVNYNKGGVYHKDPFIINQAIITTNNIQGINTYCTLYVDYFGGGNYSFNINVLYLPDTKSIKYIDADYATLPLGQHRHIHHVITFPASTTVIYRGTVLDVLDLGTLPAPYYSIIGGNTGVYSEEDIMTYEEMVTMFVSYTTPIYGIAFVYYNNVLNSYVLAIRFIDTFTFTAGAELHLPTNYRFI